MACLRHQGTKLVPSQEVIRLTPDTRFSAYNVETQFTINLTKCPERDDNLSQRFICNNFSSNVISKNVMLLEGKIICFVEIVVVK